MLHLLTTGYGTTRLCPDVRDHGEYWGVSGPSASIRQQGAMKHALHLLLVVALVCLTAVAGAQVRDRIFRIGFVVLSSAATTDAWMKAFRDELRKLGYEQGRNLTI